MNKQSNTYKGIDDIIKKAVEEGIKAGLSISKPSKQREISPYKQTEKLLYSYNDLKLFVENCKEEIAEIERYGIKNKSKGIVFMPSGSRLSPEDMVEAKLRDLNYKIQSNERELNKIDRALETIKDDDYFVIIHLKYLDKDPLNDDQIAEKIHCDRTTVCRNRNRLVLKIAINLHGSDALC